MISGISGWHVFVLLASLVPLVLWIVALVQIAGSRAASATIALWILVATLIPVVGAILWFAVGRRTAASSGQQPPLAQ